MVDKLSGFMQVYRCKNKSTEEALLREWSSSFGYPMTLVCDSGPSFRSRFSEECLKLGVRVEHSSAYNPSSQSAVERSVQSLKHLLKRSAHMNQLQISECVFAINSRVQPDGCGSPIARFFGGACLLIPRFVCPSVRLSACLPVFLSACLSVPVSFIVIM